MMRLRISQFSVNGQGSPDAEWGHVNPSEEEDDN